MKYIAVTWRTNRGYPIELYSELDDQRYECRKVEVFADGRAEFADAVEQTGDTQLGEVPVPPLADIASDSQFVPREISASEFEAVWQSARQSRGHA